MFDIEAVAARIEDFGGHVVSDLEREAHTRIGTVVTSVLHELVGLLPDGEEIKAVAETLVNVASMAHGAVHSAAAQADPGAAATALAEAQAQPSVVSNEPPTPTPEPAPTPDVPAQPEPAPAEPAPTTDAPAPAEAPAPAPPPAA